MINAVLVLDKPADFTSHDVVNRVRRIIGERSVGHLGTLDPMATGVLPLVIGRFTRLAQFFNDSSKVYEGEMRFGFATDTYDAEGQPIGPIQNAAPTLAQIQQHLPALTGHILQTPPAYSAKKVNGVASYKLARRDEQVELKAVEVEVRQFEIQSVIGDRAKFVAEVSAGTYVRSLAHDLGQALGCGAHLTSLRRTRAGEFTLPLSITLDELERYAAHPTQHINSTVLSEYTLSDIPDFIGRAGFVHPRQILTALPCVTADEETVGRIRHGQQVRLPEFSDAPLVKVFTDNDTLVSIHERIAGPLFRSRVVL